MLLRSINLFPVPRWEGANTNVPLNNNIPKTVRVNLA